MIRTRPFSTGRSGIIATMAMLFCVGSIFISGHAAASSSNDVCETRPNDTAAKLAECIQPQALWRHLEAFQRIANRNPGADGHGNRDTGTLGYKASVNYVAALMRQAGYRVTIQPYNWKNVSVTGTPSFGITSQRHRLSRDWFVARRSGGGAVTARVQPVGITGIAMTGGAGSGCSPTEFGAFVSGSIALVQRGSCAFDTAVANATAAGASAVIIYNRYNRDGAPGDTGKIMRDDGGAFEAKLGDAARIPVIGVVAHAVGTDLFKQYMAGTAPVGQIDVRTRLISGVDYNVIAESPYGDRNHVVVVDAHLDSIYGAGILDNASGSATILEIALKMAKTPTSNQLRYIWFGGEELGLLGSDYYTKALRPGELHKIVFDIDSDVTATPNFAIQVADPAFASNVKRFPPNVVPESRVGNQYFADYFRSIGVVSRPAGFGNDGTDSNSFSLIGVPNTGILTEQDCCKPAWQVKLWGGFLGNYEGHIPSYDGGCVDNPRRWCDNLSNTDQFVLGLVSKAFANVTFKLANDTTLDR